MRDAILTEFVILGDVFVNKELCVRVCVCVLYGTEKA